MMTKGKGYPEHVKDTGKSFGDAYAQDITGGRKNYLMVFSNQKVKKVQLRLQQMMLLKVLTMH